MASKNNAKEPKQVAVKGKAKAPKQAVFQLAKAMLNKLPLEERPESSRVLWEKSAGICALCSLPLDPGTRDSIVADHYTPSVKGGKTVLANLYLAHRTCNASRQHLEFEVARPLVEFRSRAEQAGHVDFDFVIDSYVEEPNRQLVQYMEGSNGVAQLRFGHSSVDVQLSIDPATGVKYFFVEAPIGFIHNDKEIQPRLIMPSHVRRLAIDFLERPVHEPSNCRLVRNGGNIGPLLQFDGQHKTTAQILIGRKTAPIKVYVDPPIPMLQALVIKIQQEIKKQPLTKSETLAKIGDVFKRILDSYEVKEGEIRTERGLIDSQPRDSRSATRKLYFDELRRIIFFDEENELSLAVGPGVSDPPTTDKVVVDKIISPLLYQQLLEVDLDAAGGRDEERKNIMLILNAIAGRMLPEGWDRPGNELQRRRAQNFFYQGSIGWWMGEILEPTLRYVLKAMGKKPLLIKPLKEGSREEILSVVEKLCSWPVWSTEDENHLKAMRSNTVKSVAQAFGEYDFERLIYEIDA